jgi:hypothetical protein
VPSRLGGRATTRCCCRCAFTRSGIFDLAIRDAVVVDESEQSIAVFHWSASTSHNHYLRGRILSSESRWSLVNVATQTLECSSTSRESVGRAGSGARRGRRIGTALLPDGTTRDPGVTEEPCRRASPRHCSRHAFGGDKSQCGVADGKGLSTLAIASSKRPQFCCGAPAMKGDRVYRSIKGFP